MRARLPDESGYVQRGEVRLYYEVFGEGPTTIFLLPTWSLVHSKVWKAQIPYLARHFRVVTFDGRGNGKSSRPLDADAYSHHEFVDDALSVMQETSTARATVVGFSLGGVWAAMLAADHSDKVAGAIFIAPSAPFGAELPERAEHAWADELTTTDGWAKHNRHYWQRDYADWLEFFAGRLFTESHSTKQREDIIEWGSETNSDVLIATYEAKPSRSAPPWDRQASLAWYGKITCPVLVIHGSDDAVIAHEVGEGVARATRGTLVTVEGGGHAVQCRDPVKVNLLIREFAESFGRGSRHAASR